MTEKIASIEMPDWPDFKPVPKSEFWVDFLRLARASEKSYHDELNLLIKRTGEAPVDLKGPDGTPLLSALLKKWDTIRHRGVTSSYRENMTLAQFPNKGEGTWDKSGNFVPWEVPAALLIARGANPFEEGPDGVRPWDIAVQIKACAVVHQMLRHPLCPRTETGADWRTLALKKIPETAEQANATSFHKDPLIYALNTAQPLLIEALCVGGKRPEHEKILFKITDSKRYRTHRINPLLITALVEAGADPVSEDENGLTPLEVWACNDELTSFMSTAWGDAVAKKVAPDRMPRAVASALFANAKEALIKIPLKPTGAEWSRGPYGAPQGMSWVEWAALGVIMRNTHNTCPAAGILKGMPIKAEKLSEAERQLVKTVQHVVDVNLDKMCGDTRVTVDSLQKLRLRLKTFNADSQCLGKVIFGLIDEHPEFYEIAADWMDNMKADVYSAKNMAMEFTDANLLKKLENIKPDDIAPLIRACSIACVIYSDSRISYDFSEKKEKNTQKGLAQLFQLASEQGLYKSLLTEKELQVIQKASDATNKKEWKSILTLWQHWTLEQAIDAPAQPGHKPRL